MAVKAGAKVVAARAVAEGAETVDSVAEAAVAEVVLGADDYFFSKIVRRLP